MPLRMIPKLARLEAVVGRNNGRNWTWLVGRLCLSIGNNHRLQAARSTSMEHPTYQTSRCQRFADHFSGPPATAFHLFPSLPIELRAKIWGYASLHPRIIEIERGPKVRDGYELFGYVCAGDEYRCRVCPASRRPPVCIEFMRTISIPAFPSKLAASRISCLDKIFLYLPLYVQKQD